ncbi:MAG: hypothetical protein J0I32_20210 [Sphingobacteriales bacterium]|nr:hypothetical protein [Sphingobacteriales bacterium]OJV98832.1 MAG: hypothetical protein BGO52_08675 [Sphingobacteriales bacterium 44-61]
MEMDLEQEIVKWKEQEQKYAKLFSPAVTKSKEFKRERLRQLLSIEAKVNKNNLQDPSILSLLKIEKKQLQKQISSGLFSFLIRKLVDAVRLHQLKKSHQEQLSNDFSEIRGALQRVGFGKYGERAEQMLSNGNGPLSISHTEQIAPKQIVEYTLNFSRKNGTSRFDNYKISFKDENSGVQRQQVFPNEGLSTMPAGSAVKLLSGMAIKDSGRDWIQMDFNDKDNQGNFKLIRFGQEKLDDGIRDALMRLPTKDQLSPEERERILHELSQGNPVRVNLAKNSNEIQAIVHANPRQSGIVVLNGDGKVLDPNKIAKEAQPKMQENQQMNRERNEGSKRMKIVR